MRPHASRTKKILFLINPGAGQKAATKVRRLAPSLFPQARWRAEYRDLGDWREIRPLAAAAAKAGAWAVVAVGGDGTINQVAQALNGTPCRMGVVPAGTGNGYARALGLPLDARGACAVIAQGRVARLDFADAGPGRGFANMLGIGYDAWVAQRANRLRWMNRFSGFARYLAAGILCLPHLKAQSLRLRLDRGRIVEGKFLMVAVANSPQYGFGCTIAPKALLDDGLLDVVCVSPTGPWTLLRNCARLFKRKELLGAAFYRTRGVRLESLEGRALAVHTDGEPGGTTPVAVALKKGALNMLVP